uniref:Uncharacterized protein n=1 Tax=Anguilla anguilla TaxID=7936 RepID=A0A0E9VIM9_ANGAN
MMGSTQRISFQWYCRSVIRRPSPVLKKPCLFLSDLWDPKMALPLPLCGTS